MFLRAKVQDEKGNFIMTTAKPLGKLEKFTITNKTVVDVCYRGSNLGNSLYHIFGRGTGLNASTQENSVDRVPNGDGPGLGTSNKLAKNSSSADANRPTSVSIDEILAIGQLQILEKTINNGSGVAEAMEDFTPDIFDDEIDSAGLL